MTISEKFKMVISSIWLTAKFFFLAAFSKVEIKGAPDFFLVSLTSYGKRSNWVFLTIESILQQKTNKPVNVVLWMYKKDKFSGFANLFISRQVQRGLQIKWLDEDYRSYKKLSYVLSLAEKFEYIITADDDVLYPSQWLAGFDNAISKASHNIYCYRGRAISFESEYSVHSYNTWPLANDENIKGNNLIPTGVSGVCYPIKSLNDKLTDFASIISLCPYADDIWFKMITTSNGYYSKLINSESIHFTPALTAFGKGLEKFNVINDLNTTQFLNSLKYFDLSRKDF